MNAAPPLVLFDIDGTLVRRAGPHHRQALIDAVHAITGLQTSMEGVPVAGMLDRDILTSMMTQAGLPSSAIRTAMPEIVRRAQWIYARSCPDLQKKVCPGVHKVLGQLLEERVVIGLVTGNLTRIGWKKLERAGLKRCFRFGAFAELAQNRAGLARYAIRQARGRQWISPRSPVSLIGDHPNDIQAARQNGIRAIAVATGVVPFGDLSTHSPDILLPDLRALDMEMLF